MAKKIMQFRYYAENHTNNQPNSVNNSISAARLVSGSIFTTYLPITQLGIQAIPGTKFYVNHSTFPIVIGSTGIYELDLEGLSTITHLRFDQSSINTIANNPAAYLIIDTISEVGGQS